MPSRKDRIDWSQAWRESVHLPGRRRSAGVLPQNVRFAGSRRSIDGCDVELERSCECPVTVDVYRAGTSWKPRIVDQCEVVRAICAVQGQPGELEGWQEGR